jgi:hypothetical protein
VRRILYFPLASPPERVALQAALYWDELLVVAPPWYQHQHPLLREMLEVGALRTVDADQILSQPNITADITEEIYQVLNGLPASQLIPDSRVELNGSNRLYAGKIPHMVEQELRSLGVLEPSSADAFRGSPEVLSVLISIIARRVADQSEQQEPNRGSVALITDRQSQLAQAVAATATQRSSAWRVNLGEQLPVPSPNVDPKALMRFRSQYADERQRFGTAVSRLASNLTVNGTTDIPALVRELHQSAADVRKASKAARVGLAVGSLVVLGSGAAFAGLDHLEIPKLVKDLSEMYLGAGIGVAVERVRWTNKPNDFAYLTRAQKEYATR